MAVVRTERGLDRLVNFSDATVAIAITLLILPLVDAATEIGDKPFSEFFQKNEWELLAFAVSFVVIARFWTVHHRIFDTVAAYSRPLMTANFLWLIAIVFIPFTANVLSNGNGERPDVYALYIGNLLLATVASRVIAAVLDHDPDLLTEEGRASIDKTAGFAEITLIAVALVLAVLVPAVGMFWLFLLFLADPLHRLLHRMVYGPGDGARPSRRDG